MGGVVAAGRLLRVRMAGDWKWVGGWVLC